MFSVAFIALACDSKGSLNPDETEQRAVYTVTGQITGLTVDVADSVLFVRTGGFETPTEVLLDARKTAVGGKVNMPFEGSILDGIFQVSQRVFQIMNPHAGLEIRSADSTKPFIGSGVNNPNVIDALKTTGISNPYILVKPEQASYERVKYILENARTITGSKSENVGKQGNIFKMGISTWPN